MSFYFLSNMTHYLQCAAIHLISNWLQCSNTPLRWDCMYLCKKNISFRTNWISAHNDTYNQAQNTNWPSNHLAKHCPPEIYQQSVSILPPEVVWVENVYLIKLLEIKDWIHQGLNASSIDKSVDGNRRTSKYKCMLICIIGTVDFPNELIPMGSFSQRLLTDSADSEWPRLVETDGMVSVALKTA